MKVVPALGQNAVWHWASADEKTNTDLPKTGLRQAVDTSILKQLFASRNATTKVAIVTMSLSNGDEEISSLNNFTTMRDSISPGAEESSHGHSSGHDTGSIESDIPFREFSEEPVSDSDGEGEWSSFYYVPSPSPIISPQEIHDTSTLPDETHTNDYFPPSDGMDELLGRLQELKGEQPLHWIVISDRKCYALPDGMTMTMFLTDDYCRHTRRGRLLYEQGMRKSL